MADPETTTPAVNDANQDDESRLLLGFLRPLTCDWSGADLIAGYPGSAVADAPLAPRLAV
jgi:hypothetical protein